MRDRANTVREVLWELESIRSRNMDTLDARKREVGAKYPRIAELMESRTKAFRESFAGAMRNPEKARETSQRLGKRIEEINLELRKALTEAGYEEDYLQPIYTCQLCKDTGYVGEPIHTLCQCVQKRVMEKMVGDTDYRLLQHENFESYDETIIPETTLSNGMTQREAQRRIRNICKKYADNFDPGSGESLMMVGSSGLGKTFLMNCVCQRVIERGYQVVVTTAFKLAEIMRDYQFNGTSAEAVREMVDADLLAVDDLGAEPRFRNLTGSGILFIINERYNAGKPMIFTTNCPPPDLYINYGDRVAARILDPVRTKIFLFEGNDLRRFRNS